MRGCSVSWKWIRECKFQWERNQILFHGNPLQLFIEAILKLIGQLDSVRKIVNYVVRGKKKKKKNHNWSLPLLPLRRIFKCDVFIVDTQVLSIKGVVSFLNDRSSLFPTFFFLFLIVSPGDKPLCRHHHQSFCPSKLRTLKVSKALAVVFHLLSFIVKKLQCYVCFVIYRSKSKVAIDFYKNVMNEATVGFFPHCQDKCNFHSRISKKI